MKTSQNYDEQRAMVTTGCLIYFRSTGVIINFAEKDSHFGTVRSNRTEPHKEFLLSKVLEICTLCL